jgi:hypothetical protein
MRDHLTSGCSGADIFHSSLTTQRRCGAVLQWAVGDTRTRIHIEETNPGKYSFGSAGNGTGSHLSGELFKLLAGVDILHVPYKGVAPALLDVVSGQVSMSFPSILSGTPQWKSGKARALAVTGAKRSPAVPELPTMVEAGVKGYESATWYGVLAPARTPQAIVSKLSGEIVAILAQPEMRERLSKEGADPVGSSLARGLRGVYESRDRQVGESHSRGEDPGELIVQVCAPV